MYPQNQHPGEGFDEYVYIDEKVCRSLPAEGGNALEDLQSLYERGVRRLVVPMTVTPQGADWATKQENAMAQGREWAERLAPYAAARESCISRTGTWSAFSISSARGKSFQPKLGALITVLPSSLTVPGMPTPQKPISSRPRPQACVRFKAVSKIM